MDTMCWPVEGGAYNFATIFERELHVLSKLLSCGGCHLLILLSNLLSLSNEQL